MTDWLKDLLGINRYVLAWDFIAGRGTHLKGRDSRSDTKFYAQRLASGMNKIYGAGTHWIERV
ncbi:hypothetical protein LB559_09365 [Mesorhizobium sp. BR1-1-3]|uniref:hypothetical protein n=1 Tax=Mesorhizobium sp. BR1-1-3 TaxID=2876651 RepID=UPI001CD1352E|nr:hypothetical protein [Mesorhizobium sp. BR1-1-3]MBZ9888147.1 hypothetical protein [Mesorhizobium sp. BR1-1-3]